MPGACVSVGGRGSVMLMTMLGNFQCLRDESAGEMVCHILLAQLHLDGEMSRRRCSCKQVSVQETFLHRILSGKGYKSEESLPLSRAGPDRRREPADRCRGDSVQGGSTRRGFLSSI